jgi:RNA polymerase sigma factor (sigma-70 family)
MENSKFNITEKTTLGELLAILHLGEKPGKTPTPKELRETAGDPVAEEERCLVYSNGWVVYDNGSGRTVLWLPDCVSFTYQFIKPEKNEAREVSACEELPEGLLASQPWPIAVTLAGDHRIEGNLMNRTGSRKGTKAYEYEVVPEFEEDTPEETFIKELFFHDASVCENPETGFIRKEMIQEMLNRMTERQRKAFVLVYRDGYSEVEAACLMHISQQSVYRLLTRARATAKKFLKFDWRGV